MKRLFFFFVVGCLCSVPAGADELKKVVIETTLGTGVEESLKGMFMSALTAGLTNSEQFEVIANRQEYTQKIAGEIAAQEGGIVDDSQWLDFGRASGAQLVIYTKIEAFDNNYFITVSLIDLASGVAKKTIDPIISSRSEIVSKALELSRSISGGGIRAERKLISDNDVKCVDIPGGYIQKTELRRGVSWEEAVRECEKKGDGWRLPTKDELIAIFRTARNNPGIYGPFENTTYWTCDKRNNFSIFTVAYPYAGVTYESSASDCKFRCVYNR